METSRNLTLAKLVAEAGEKMGNLAKWPESEATKEEADHVVKVLRKTFREDSYPRAFLYLAMCQIAHGMWSDTVNRDVKAAGLRNAWMKIGELLGDA
jgi:hypothetical protein